MAMTKDFRTILNRFKVPKAEQAELFARVGSVKPGIVTHHFTASLDGKVYVGCLGEDKKWDRGDAHADTFTFKDGRFHSAACDPWHFDSGQYTTSTAGGGTHLMAEIISSNNGHMLWEAWHAGAKLKAPCAGIRNRTQPQWRTGSVESKTEATLR
jgi:hypothetical protein